MYSVAITIVAIICAVNWLVRYVCCAAYLLYMLKKYDETPSEQEMRACCREVLEHFLRIK